MANPVDSRTSQNTPPATPTGPAATAAGSGSVKNALWNATSNQPWGQTFWNALEASGVPRAIDSGGAVTSGAEAGEVFRDMSPADQQAVKDSLYNAVKDLPSGKEAWNAMWQAGLVPGAPAQPASSGQPTSPAQSGSSAQSSGASQPRGSATPPPGGSSAAASPAGTPSVPTSGSSSTAAQAGSMSSSTGGAAAQGNAAGSRSGSSAAAGGQGQSTSPSGTSPAATAAGDPSSSTAAAGTGATSAVSGSGQSGGYSRDQMAKDLESVLKEQQGSTTLGGASKRNFGDKEAFKKWTPQQLDQLYSGLTTAHDNFYPNMPMKDFAHMVLAEGAQESSGNPLLGCDDRDKTSRNNLSETGARGFMQVTPGSVVKYFREYGTPIKDAQGNVVADPKGDIDLTNPAVNVAMWGWYTKNVVALSQNIEELKWHPTGANKTTPDFGNAQTSWLQGGNVDRHRGQGDEDYRSRTLSYFVNAGFGTEAQFNALQNTNIGDNTVNLRK